MSVFYADNITVADTLTVGGTVTTVDETGVLTITGQIRSDTAFATPAALTATGARWFASTVSGGVLMGFGTTNDVALMNRAGTVCLGVGPNTTAINIPGTLAVTGAATFVDQINLSTSTAAINFKGSAGVYSFINANTTDVMQFSPASAGVVLALASTGATVTGTLAVTGAATLGAAGATLLNLGGAAAAASTSTRFSKATTAIADATGTAVLTVTIPNAAHSGSVRVTLVGSLGAGGAIGANEASGTVSYDFAVARTAGVNAVTAISSAYGSGMASVAGAATITVTAAASAISGAVGAVNTFTVNVTITKGSGASANHTCLVMAEVLNANATGITLS